MGVRTGFLEARLSRTHHFTRDLNEGQVEQINKKNGSHLTLPPELAPPPPSLCSA